MIHVFRCVARTAFSVCQISRRNSTAAMLLEYAEQNGAGVEQRRTGVKQHGAGVEKHGAGAERFVEHREEAWLLTLSVVALLHSRA